MKSKSDRQPNATTATTPLRGIVLAMAALTIAINSIGCQSYDQGTSCQRRTFLPQSSQNRTEAQTFQYHAQSYETARTTHRDPTQSTHNPRFIFPTNPAYRPAILHDRDDWPRAQAPQTYLTTSQTVQYREYRTDHDYIDPLRGSHQTYQRRLRSVEQTYLER